MKKWVESRWVKLTWNIMFALFLAVVLASCGGGGGGGGTPSAAAVDTLSGVAATGAPMSGGSLYLNEANGTPHGPYPINASGNYQIDVTNFIPPFYLKACNVGNTLCLYSIAMDEQDIANINPLTNWAVMIAAGVNDPAYVFDDPVANAITPPDLINAINGIKGNFAGLFSQFGITQDFLTDPYVADPVIDKLDGLLEPLELVFDTLNGKVTFWLNGMNIGWDYIDNSENSDDDITNAEIIDALSTASVSGLGYNYPPIYQATLEVNTSNNSLKYVDFADKLQFDSTSMSVAINGGTATITGSGTVTYTDNGDTISGCSYSATVTDGSPDAMGIVINDSAGDQVYSSNGSNAVINGNYTVGGSVSGLGYNYPPIYQATLNVNTSNNSLRYVDLASQLQFDSTSMSVVINGGTASITGSGTVTDTTNNTTTSGYSYTATVTDGSPDAMGIVINDSAGDQVYSSNGSNAVVNGNFNVTP